MYTAVDLIVISFLLLLTNWLIRAVWVKTGRLNGPSKYVWTAQTRSLLEQWLLSLAEGEGLGT
jgi:hypothetical protein